MLGAAAAAFAWLVLGLTAVDIRAPQPRPLCGVPTRNARHSGSRRNERQSPLNVSAGYDYTAQAERLAGPKVVDGEPVEETFPHIRVPLISVNRQVGKPRDNSFENRPILDINPS